jgi:hypothetical protein
MARPPIETLARNLPGLIKRRLAEDTEYLRAAAYDACLAGERHAVQLTDKEGLVDQGQFKASWKAARLSNGAEVRNDAPHAPTLEYGRRPNRPGPPLAPILEWVERKLVGNGEVAPEDALHVARAIQAKIHREGSPAHHILARTWTRMKVHFDRACRRRLKDGRAWGS